MKDSVFIDTNILIYSYSSDELDKLEIARALITNNNTFVSTQVLQEVTNTLTKKFKVSYNNAIEVINEIIQNNNLYQNTKNTIIKACLIAEKYKFSFYDSMILAAALESNCSIIFTEDLQHNQIIENKITIINPFIKD